MNEKTQQKLWDAIDCNDRNTIQQLIQEHPGLEEEYQFLSQLSDHLSQAVVHKPDPKLSKAVMDNIVQEEISREMNAHQIVDLSLIKIIILYFGFFVMVSIGAFLLDRNNVNMSTSKAFVDLIKELGPYWNSIFMLMPSVLILWGFSWKNNSFYKKRTAS